jgi:luciferase family oxidoreductase group 1
MNPATPADIRLSMLDLSTLADGSTSTDALNTTTAMAVRAEELGFTRFWVAEHHNGPSVACTSPGVLIAHLAARTEHIRVGSGGVMLPNHSPLVVAEQFAMLEALHPHRIDLGIGRAPGTDQATAAALRRSPDRLGADDFPHDLIDLMGLLGDPRADRGMWNQFRATSAATSAPPIFLLGSSNYSAQLSAQLGLGFAYAHHFAMHQDMSGTLQAAELYHRLFRPSAALAEPYMIVSASVMAADTAEEAQYQAAPSRLIELGRRSGRSTPLLPPAVAATHPDIDRANSMPSNRIIGDAASVAGRLHDLAAQTGARELMITAVAYDLEARLHSMELVAREWGLAA